MPESSAKLSNTARTVLTHAAARHDHLVRVPQLQMAAARQVIRSLLNAGLVDEIPAPIDDADLAWRTGEDGSALIPWEFPRLCRGGSRSLTFPGVFSGHPSMKLRFVSCQSTRAMEFDQWTSIKA